MAGIVPKSSFGLEVSSAVSVPESFKQNQIRCSSCHREHQGKNHDLKRLSDTQCQVCHKFQFGSFAHEHPSFGSYPFSEPTRIAFDHQRHLREHFKKSENRDLAPTSCLGCHRLDDKGNSMIIKPFEQSCASCHAKEFPGFDKKAPAIPFLRIPLIDVETLEEEEIGIGEWPDDWDSLETRLSPFSQLLLSHDEHHAHAVSQMGDQDLDALEGEQLSSAGRIAWGLKELLFDVSEKGSSEIIHRVESALKRKLNPAESSALSEVMAPDLFKETAKHWFPNLASEVKAHREGNNPLSKFMDPDAMEKRLSTEPVFLGGSWFRSDVDLTVYYRPAHHADPFLKIWMQLAWQASTGGETNIPTRLAKSLMGASQKVVPGRCLKCHSAETEPFKVIQWQSLRPNPIERSFNRFSHSAHFSLLDSKGCVTCHSMNHEADGDAYLSAFDYHRTGKEKSYASNFGPIDKTTCASCHTKTRAGESCLTCHNYHVGRFEGTATKGALFETMDPRLLPTNGVESVKK